MFTDAKTLAGLPMGDNFDTKRINEFCRTGRLYAFKTSDAPFTPWTIPIDSFGIFLQQNQFYKQNFINMMEYQTVGMRDKELKLVKKIEKYTKTPVSEDYTIQQLSDIFDAPVNQVTVWLAISKLPFGLFSRAKTVNSDRVCEFLYRNPDRLNALKERHGILLANGDFMEQQVRHLLMLYTYYMDRNHREDRRV